MKILAVDDDEVMREVLKTSLTKLGHEVVIAADGQEALDRFSESPFSVVISDWLMPNFSGLELCKQIRDRCKTSYCYFILVTTRAGRKDYLAAMDFGIDDLLVKPFGPEDLFLCLRVAGRILDFAFEVRQLKGILPICVLCKKVRDDHDYWHQIESYIHAQTGTDFSHSLCPDCLQKHLKTQQELYGPLTDAGKSHEIQPGAA